VTKTLGYQLLESPNFRERTNFKKIIGKIWKH